MILRACQVAQKASAQARVPSGSVDLKGVPQRYGTVEIQSQHCGYQNRDKAVEQLMELCGKAHEVWQRSLNATLWQRVHYNTRLLQSVLRICHENVWIWIHTRGGEGLHQKCLYKNTVFKIMYVLEAKPHSTQNVFYLFSLWMFNLAVQSDVRVWC